jgi:hypothetical protein
MDGSRRQQTATDGNRRQQDGNGWEQTAADASEGTEGSRRQQLLRLVFLVMMYGLVVTQKF